MELIVTADKVKLSYVLFVIYFDYSMPNKQHILEKNNDTTKNIYVSTDCHKFVMVL